MFKLSDAFPDFAASKEARSINLKGWDWDMYEHDVIAGAATSGQMHGITERLVAPPIR